MARSVKAGVLIVLTAAGIGALPTMVQGQAPAAQAAAQAPSALTLGDAMTRALEANRTLLAARSARAIDVAGVAAAGQRPNPEVSFEYARETPRWAFTGAVPLDVNGKRQRRIDVANATLAVTEAETARVAADVRADVRRAYYQAVAAGRRVAITQELVGIATRARDAAQERFQTGAAPRLEALQASLTLAQAQNDVTAAQGELRAARADLNALLAYPSDAAPALGDALDAGPLPTEAAVTEQTLAANAELQVLQKQIDEARARLALAKAMRRPDPSVSAALTYDSPPEFMYGWRAGASVALPVFTTGRPDVAVAEATVARAVADRDARIAQISGGVAAALARATAARQTFDRYQAEILPASVQVEQMAEESYRAGQTGLPAFLQAVQTARDIRQRALQAGLDYQLALADLERAMGTALR
ncbi:MAG TPA: TolC family protein [Vicinamibacterales bacterium]|jgi:cobalt-zinc-cadmium efflux system outer membrane protein|nr:TolC family protein [Vicinamibacterales bacterium]